MSYQHVGQFVGQTDLQVVEAIELMWLKKWLAPDENKAK